MSTQTGSWWGLVSAIKQRDFEFGYWQDIVTSEGGLSCPVCGEPLQPAGTGPSDVNAAVQKHCRFGGDHRFHVPEDVVAPQRGARMGRYG